MNTIKRLYMIPVLLICAAGFVAAQEKETTEILTVDRAVELAMQNNIQLASTAIDVRIKKRAKDLAWNVFLPSAQATGTLARSNNVSNPYAGILSMINPMYREPELQEKDHWAVMAGLNLSLNLNMALVEGFRATRLNYESGLLNYEQARQETEINVKKAFYGILLQEGSLIVSQDKLAASEDRLTQTRINYKNGLVPELAYLQTQLAVETQKPAIMEAALNLDQQKNMFGFLLGLPLGTTISLDGEIAPILESLNADELVNKHLGNRLDLAILQKNRELVETQLKATQLQRYTPSIALSQSFAPRLSAIDDSWTDSENWNDNSGAFSVTIAFNITNLLPFSSMGVTAAETRDTIEKISMGFNQMVYQAELEIRNLVKKLDKANVAIKAMELNVAMAQKAYQLTEQGYRAGTIEYLDVKDAENTLVQARLGVLSEKFNYLSALLDLEKALNTKLR